MGKVGKEGPPALIEPGIESQVLQVLSPEQLSRIDDLALQILEEVGIGVQPDSKAFEIFRAHGARVDEERGRVFLDRGVVEDYVAMAPRRIDLHGRDPKHTLRLEGNRVHTGSGGAAIRIMDLDGQVVRKTTLADVANVGRLVDALDNIHFYLRACVAQDVPSEALDLSTYWAAINSTTKHVTGNCFTVESFQDVMAMLKVVAGGADQLRENPIASFITCWTISPLNYAPETVEVLTAIAQEEMPVFLSSAPQAASTGPANLTEMMAMLHAEQLSGIAYTQMVKPGTPVIPGYVPLVMDLRTAGTVTGTPEQHLMMAAAPQLAHLRDLPVYNSAGLTDSKVPDIQAGYEKGFAAVAAILSGANYIHHAAGFLEAMGTIAYVQYVIDNVILGHALRMARGFSEDASIETIQRVVESGDGHFLTTEQTIELMGSGFWYPGVASRESREAWSQNGGTDMYQRATEEAQKILNTHQPEPLPPEVVTRVQEMFAGTGKLVETQL